MQKDISNMKFTHNMVRVTVTPIGEAVKTFKKLFSDYDLEINGRDVYIKINAVDFRKGCYTSPHIIGAAIDALYDHGASRVYVMENCTQGNFTRLVFKVTGIERVTKEKGAKPIYLDEEKSARVRIGEFEVDFPKIVYENIKNGDAFYLSLPKLKTHDMTTVTLNLKNQFGFIYHKDRRIHHSKFELHKFIAAIYDFIKPDFSVIDGEFAVVNGHYPLEKMYDKYVVPMNVFVASNDALAADIVASKILGFEVDEVEHLKLANEKYDIADKIEIEGDISRFKQKYSHKPLGIYPEGVKIVKGKERACNEGCQDNTLMVLEMLHVDYDGSGEFTIVFGKGFYQEELENLKPPVLVVGPCAVEEVGDYLKKKYRKVVEVPYCNDLAAVTEALMKFMGLKATRIVPISTLSLIATWLKAKIHGSTANTPSIF
jgi:uncharacterized protein (DUF362 family)